MSRHGPDRSHPRILWGQDWAHGSASEVLTLGLTIHHSSWISPFAAAGRPPEDAEQDCRSPGSEKYCLVPQAVELQAVRTTRTQTEPPAGARVSADAGSVAPVSGRLMTNRHTVSRKPPPITKLITN